LGHNWLVQNADEVSEVSSDMFSTVLANGLVFAHVSREDVFRDALNLAVQRGSSFQGQDKGIIMSNCHTVCYALISFY